MLALKNKVVDRLNLQQFQQIVWINTPGMSWNFVQVVTSYGKQVLFRSVLCLGGGATSLQTLLSPKGLLNGGTVLVPRKQFWWQQFLWHRLPK